VIPFNRPPRTGNEEQYVVEAINSSKMAGDGPFSRKCQEWFEENLGCDRALLTPSCTASLEMAAILIDIQPGDEVIMPSYTFVSTANAFALRGAKIIFVDVRPDTMNIDEGKIEQAITSKTKALVVVHYAGVACEMDPIIELADKYSLYVVEDAAQAMMSTYKNRPLGTIGHIGAYSFHETKNYTSAGEGGLLILNEAGFAERAEVIREKGTNRSQFFRGTVDKYTWVDVGSSFLPSDVQASYLWGQIERSLEINEERLSIWNRYYDAFSSLAGVELPYIPAGLKHNAHMFYLKLKDLGERASFIDYMASCGVMTVFHYIPLHSSPAGKEYSVFSGKDEFTTKESERLVRLPLWINMTDEEIERVISSVRAFFS
jgi:dTDP-4-amino-4,6-dideoxygalactose transaminase